MAWASLWLRCPVWAHGMSPGSHKNTSPWPAYPQRALTCGSAYGRVLAPRGSVFSGSKQGQMVKSQLGMGSPARTSVIPRDILAQQKDVTCEWGFVS